MARYIGPKIKLSRRFGVKLGLRTNEEGASRRPYRPGAHGAKGRRGRLSEYGVQLQEKQKAKYIYGVLEKQFRRYYTLASKDQNIGLSLLQILETRLDSVVARSGFALTQNQARQFVSHGHVKVDGKRVNIPSFQVKPGMVVTIDDHLKKLVEEQRGHAAEIPSWLAVEKDGVKVLDTPNRDHITALINEQLIVEFYSR